MAKYQIGNDDLSMCIEAEREPGVVRDFGLRITSIRDEKLFEFSVKNGPARNATGDLRITAHANIDPGRAVRISAKCDAENVSFVLEFVVDGDNPAIVITLTAKNERDEPVLLRMVFPKLHALRTRGNYPIDTLGMVPIEIGSVVPLLQQFCSAEVDPGALGVINQGTMGSPYRGEAHRVGLPLSMNAMEVIAYYAPEGGGLFVADIEHDLDAADPIAPVQLTLSILGVDGFWVAQLPAHSAKSAPKVAIGVFHTGHWQAAVDYYQAKHRQRHALHPPAAPDWFEREAAIYSPTGGGGGGIYLHNVVENLPDSVIATSFEVGGKWPEKGPIPLTQAGLAPAGAPLAVAVRPGGNLDVFVVGKSGAVAWIPVRGNGRWMYPAKPITGEGFAQPGSAIAAVARHGGQVDVFVIGADGVLKTVFGPGDEYMPPDMPPLWPYLHLTEPRKAWPQGAIAAITREEKHVDVFFIGVRGQAVWTYERNNGTWLAAPRNLSEQGVWARPGGLAALARNAVQTDLFYVDADGVLTTLYKTTPADDGRWHTVQLGMGKRLASRGGGGVAAIVRQDKDEDVFTIGDGGIIHQASMRNNQGWTIPAPIVPTRQSDGRKSDKRGVEGAPLCALARANRTDLFFVDQVGALVRFYHEAPHNPAALPQWKDMDQDHPSIPGFSVPGGATAAALRSDLQDAQEDVFLVQRGRLSSFLDLPQLLGEARSLGSNVVYLWDYWEGVPAKIPDERGAGLSVPLHPPYFVKGDYFPREDLGGGAKLKEGIRLVHEEGGKVILYVEPFIIWKDSHVARYRPDKNEKSLGERLAGRFPTRLPLAVMANELERTGFDDGPMEWNVYPHNHTMVPALPEWRTHVRKVVRRLVGSLPGDLGADGVFLDSFGWQMNWPMRVHYEGPGIVRTVDCSQLDYVKGVLKLADEVREEVGPDRVVLVETPSGPISRHCHGGTSADFGFHVDARLSSQSRIVASPTRYAMPEVRYFGNGGQDHLAMKRLHQLYAAGHNLALCHQHITDGYGAHIKRLVEIRRQYADALMRGRQLYLQASGSDVAAIYLYRGDGERAILTVVNTAEDQAQAVKLTLPPEDANTVWTDLLTMRRYVANGVQLHLVVPSGRRPASLERDPTADLLILLRGQPWFRGFWEWLGGFFR